MAWLARLDASAARWPLPLRWLYLALRWSLIAWGAIAVTLLFWERLHLFRP